MKIETFLIPPTDFTITVIISRSIEKARKYIMDSFIDIHEIGKENIQLNMVARFACLENGSNIVMTLKSKNPAVATHEIIHVLWHIGDMANLEMNYDSQEWQAYLAEYLMNKIQSM